VKPGTKKPEWNQEDQTGRCTDEAKTGQEACSQCRASSPPAEGPQNGTARGKQNRDVYVWPPSKSSRPLGKSPGRHRFKYLTKIKRALFLLRAAARVSVSEGANSPKSRPQNLYCPTVAEAS